MKNINWKLDLERKKITNFHTILIQPKFRCSFSKPSNSRKKRSWIHRTIYDNELKQTYFPRSNRTARKRSVPRIYGDFMEAVFQAGIHRIFPLFSCHNRPETIREQIRRFSSKIRTPGHGPEPTGSSLIF